MNTGKSKAGRKLISLVMTGLLSWPSLLTATDGHFLHGAGPVNEAMGGADTGICLDVAGSIRWNPACTDLFKGRRLEVYGTFFDPWRSVSSTVDANAFGPGVPGATLSGTTDSRRGAAFMPGLAFIYHPQESKNAYHFEMVAVSGFGVDYKANTDFSNPIFTPQPPNGFGFGRVRSSYALLEMPVGMSRQLTKNLSFGFSAVPAVSLLQVTPAPFAAPVMAGSTEPYYLSAGNKAPAYGGGGSAGLHYQINKMVSVGAAYHSTVWFQPFTWHREDLTGALHTLHFRMNLPQYVTMGIGVSPSEKTKIAADVRWFDYANAQGFEKVGFNPDGSVKGFGWQSIWAAGGGVEQQVTSTTKLIGGFNYSQNPVPAKYTFFNLPAPAIVQYHVTSGVEQKLRGAWTLNGSFYHAFRNSITGPWISPQGAVPGTSVTSRMRENSLTIGVSRSL